MPRHRCPRFLQFKPDVYYFKPRGIPLRYLQTITLQPDELESLKLYEVDGLDQTTAAKQMRISQPTFARILDHAQRKVAEAIIKGKAIEIQEKGLDP
ncbi:DUF134 domain-containing protein [Patescibacteria group bacterium]|nr:DUF134 domain-containing protein [Patescibacteria group bacterium]MCL5409541.1 DUF134 domain-containing protein [Patescibacteria group bacterium]